MDLRVRFTKISGTILNFKDGQRIPTGTHYASAETDVAKKMILIRTHALGKIIESKLQLQGSDDLDFSILSDDSSIPIITGRFLNSDYEEGISAASMPGKNINVVGSLTKLNDLSAVSIKTLLDATSGKTIAVVQERIEQLSLAQFDQAVESLSKTYL